MNANAPQQTIRIREMISLAKIFLYTAGGELFVLLTGLSIPGSIIGLGLMLVDFAINGQADPIVAEVFDRISSHFSILFLPAGAGVIAYSAVLIPSALAVVLTVLAGTLLTMLITAFVLSLLLDRVEPSTSDCTTSSMSLEKEQRDGF